MSEQLHEQEHAPEREPKAQPRIYVASLSDYNAGRLHGVWLDANQDVEELQAAVDDANSLVSRAESIRQFRVLSVDFTVDSGLLTSSLKLKRAAIEATFAAEIADIYDMATPQTLR